MEDRYEGPEGLARLAVRLHDRWFDAEGIRHDPVRRVLEIPFEDADRPRRDAGGRINASLLVLDAGAPAVDDNAGIRYYDSNEFVYDNGSGTLQISSGFSFVLRVPVARLELSVARTQDC